MLQLVQKTLLGSAVCVFPIQKLLKAWLSAEFVHDKIERIP